MEEEQKEEEEGKRCAHSELVVVLRKSELGCFDGKDVQFGLALKSGHRFNNTLLFSFFFF